MERNVNNQFPFPANNDFGQFPDNSENVRWIYSLILPHYAVLFSVEDQAGRYDEY